MAPILIVVGLLLALVGAVDIGLLYVPLRIGDSEWEFGTIAQTFDAMPLFTLGLVLLAVGIRVRGGTVVWPRSLSGLLALVALLCAAGLLLFGLDIPVAFKAIQRASTGPNAQAAAAASSGVKRVMLKVVLLGGCYTAAYGWLSVRMWRTDRKA